MDPKRSSCSFLKLVDVHNPTKVLMADKFWGQFYGSSYKGGSATLYLGDRFWNVKMEALSDKCAFTDGWSNLIRDLELDSRTTFIFTMAGYETFELSVFNHETGTQMYFKKVDVVVLDDPIYGDDGFDLLLTSEHKEKVITNESDVDEDLGGDIVGESNRLSFSFDAYRSHNEPKGKSKIVFGHETVSAKVHPKVKSTHYIYKGLSTKVERKGKSTDFVSKQNLSSHVVSQAKVKSKSFRSTTSTALQVGRKCSTSKKLKQTDVIKFTKKAESRLVYFIIFCFLLIAHNTVRLYSFF
ncbi:putative transcription factor B3-Domain family [Helianthus annuus]|nr:putative transcription factor B3-Domain family [Helianthus annuus]